MSVGTVTTTTDLLDLVNQLVAFCRQPQPTFEYAIRGKLVAARGTRVANRQGVPRRGPVPSGPESAEYGVFEA